MLERFRRILDVSPIEKQEIIEEIEEDKDTFMDKLSQERTIFTEIKYLEDSGDTLLNIIACININGSAIVDFSTTSQEIKNRAFDVLYGAMCGYKGGYQRLENENIFLFSRDLNDIEIICKPDGTYFDFLGNKRDDILKIIERIDREDIIIADLKNMDSPLKDRLFDILYGYTISLEGWYRHIGEDTNHIMFSTNKVYDKITEVTLSN